MRFPILIRATLLSTVAGLLTGCAVVPTPTAAEKEPKTNEVLQAVAPKDDRDLIPNEQTERRIEAYARFSAGVTYELRDEPEKALQEFYLGAMADPANEFLVTDVTRRLLQSNDNKHLVQADELLRKAVKAPTASGRLFALQGVVLLRAGKKDQAIAANRQAIKKSPDLLQPYQNLVQIYLKEKQAKEALQTLDEAAKHVSANADSLISLAELFVGYYRLQADEGGALKPRVMRLLDQAAELKPTSPVLLHRLADGYRVAGALDKATKLYLDLLQRVPNLPGLREKLTDVYIRSGDRKKAAEQLEAIVRNNPSDAHAYVFLGTLAFEDKKYDDAAGYLEKALLFRPELEPVYYELAGIQINSNKARNALETLAKAREKFKAKFVMEYYSGLAYSRMKQYGQALKSFTAAELLAKTGETNQLTDDLYFQLGASHERNKDYLQAEKHFKKCLELAPDNASALNYLGYMWAERGENLQEARKLIEKAIKLEPKSAAFLDSMAWVLFKLNEPKQALGYLLQAIKLSEEPDATLYDHLGDIYAALKQHAQAREAWQKSISIEPNPVIKNKLEASPPKGSAAP